MADFWALAKLGFQLAQLHIRFENPEINPPFPLTITVDTNELDDGDPVGYQPQVLMKTDEAAGTILVERRTEGKKGPYTVIEGIPAEAWDYKLGNRSALGWICDQFKPKKQSDATLAELFPEPPFAERRAAFLTLAAQVVAVSVATVRLVGEIGVVELG